MNNADLKTIAQIARELNVSRQAIYAKLKLPEISSVMCQYTVRHNNRTLYTSDFVNVLKQAFESVNTVQTLDTICQDSTLQLQLADKDKQIAVLQSEVDSLAAQLKEKEIQIAELKADKNKLNSRLDAAETNISNLTAALQAAQALHGIDKKQAVIDMTAQDQTEQQPQKELAEDPSSQKISLLQRLFGRRRK